MIKNIIFDIGNVLAGFDWLEYLKSYGFPKEKEQAIARATFRSPNWSEMDRGVLSFEELKQRFVQNAPEYAPDILRVIENCYKCITRRDYAISWIQTLRALGLRVYYLSNYSEYILEHTRESALDFLPYTDGGIFSFEVKQIKPDAAIFQTLMKYYPEIIPEESVFFDDVAENVEGAAALDFHGILFRNKAQAENALNHLMEAMNNQPGETA